MDDNDSSGKRDENPGQATVPQAPLHASASPATSNATVLGTPLEGAVPSPPAAQPEIALTSFAPPLGAIAKTVTEVPESIAANVAKTVTEVPESIAANVAKTVTEVPQNIASKPAIAPPPSRPKAPADTIPVLPVALGVGALVAGVVLFAVIWGSSKNTAPEGSVPTDSPALVNDSRNHWIRIEGAAGKVIGTNDNDLPPSVRGLRPAHEVLAPATAFDIQQHEVTWEELDPWLEKNPTHAFPKPTTGLTSADARKSLPAYGVPWTTALEYCRAVGGTLPTEEQWELAARGSVMKKFPWGNAAPDWSRVHAFKGEMAGPAKVMSNEQDRTEGAAEKAIYDLAGNVQEWTFSVWRDDFPGMDESWTQAQGTTAYAVRGFPLHRDAPGRSDELSIAYRDWICATGDCSPLSSGASPKERARTPKLELWAGADSTQLGALEWRRVIEKPDVMSALTRCLSSPTSTTLTVKAAKESFCKRPEQVPANATCDGQPALTGALARITSGLPESTLKCVNYALHDASAANIGGNLPETQFTYAAYVSTNPEEALRHVGFRCVREAGKR